MLARFSELYEKMPCKRLFNIHGSIAAYVKEFQDLMSEVKMAEEHLIDVFFNGLKKEMKEDIKTKEPVGLPNHIVAMIAMEDNEFCRMMSSTSLATIVSQKQATTLSFRPTSIHSQNNERRVTTETVRNPQDKPPLKLSDAEYEHKKKNKLCLRMMRNGQDHTFYKNKELKVTIVVHDSELELVEEQFMDSIGGTFGE